ncbi:uncharacterized protein LOC127841378 isoform X1 [Dreissena polymorpha]|uniref:3CxxC-type domain-containing protein n=1 Tax=Dreissena polymorpha TaxID=45954 RepID=A0A9D4IZM5_DREPO|nr:uncharacterized protein LOC127841378 isoform X1 [Dreissena polymorpha]KAH3790218.1 hypothetical protein DPMN_168414 [Dreissena polymorpha]
MLAMVPPNGMTSVAQSPSSVSPTLSAFSGSQFGAFNYGLPTVNLSYIQGMNGGIPFNAFPATALGGFAFTGLPASCGFTAANGYSFGGYSNNINCTQSPTSCGISGCSSTGPIGAITINGVTMAPPNALTAPEVYGLPSSTFQKSNQSTSSSPKSSGPDSPGSGEVSPAPLTPAQSMELVWHGEFDRLFSQYFPHMWCLVPTFYPPGETWRTFKDSAKVRFSCQDCGHGWTSMKGRVIFWFELNYATNSGCVMFKLYGQQCQKCKTGKFEHAMWYPEEVVKVVGNVYNRVGQIYYGFVRPPLRIDRRVGKPRNQHNSELCQACKEGLCKEEWSFS